MVSLLSLETEIVSLILEFVDDSSPRSTKAVACVSRYLNELTKAIAHRYKVINLEGPLHGNTTKLIKSWSSDASILANVRTLTIKGSVYLDPGLRGLNVDDSGADDDNQDDEAQEEIDSDAEEYSQQGSDTTSDDNQFDWTPLVTFLSKIGKLRQFDWNIRHPLPLTVFDAFEKHQKASRLRIFDFVRDAAQVEVPEPIELRLAKSRALTHIRTVVEAEPFNTRRSSDLQELAFRSIVASAPRLEYAGFLLRNSYALDEERVADLERWKPIFNTNKKPNSSVKQLTIDGVAMSKKTLDDWSSTIDLNALENIKFSRGLPSLDYFQGAATMLPNLKHLSLNLRNVKDWINHGERDKIIPAIQNYIATCAPLQTLSLWSWMDVVPLPDILQRHGASLISLQLHERETGYSRDRQLLSVEDVRAIRSSCPELKSFTFDLARQSRKLRWDRDRNRRYYDELAKFENLDHIQIYFDAGNAYIFSPDNRYARPDDITDIPSDEDNDGYDEEEEEPPNKTVPSNHTVSTTPGNPTPSSPSSPSSQPQAQPQTQSRNEPAAKRLRTLKTIPPSLDANLTPYVTNIWTTIYGSRRGGSRCLEVKIGEWEAGGGAHHGIEQRAKRHVLVRPHERDDVSEPAVSVFRKR